MTLKINGYLPLKIFLGQELRPEKSACNGDFVVQGSVCRVIPLLTKIDLHVKFSDVFVFLKRTQQKGFIYNYMLTITL